MRALRQVNQQLQDSLQATTKAHQAERAKRENLHKQVRDMYLLRLLAQYMKYF